MIIDKNSAQPSYYFKENKANIYHLVFAKEGTAAGNIFNKNSITFIRTVLSANLEYKNINFFKDFV